MSVGGTVARFTDTVSVESNIVATGTLEVSMAWAKGTDDPDSASWQDASAGAIFNYDRWEPGYAEARHVRIGNEGQLALTYPATAGAHPRSLHMTALRSLSMCMT